MNEPVFTQVTQVTQTRIQVIVDEFMDGSRGSKEGALVTMIYELRKQHFAGPHSSGRCRDKSCGAPSRGGNYCAACVEMAIAVIAADPDAASALHSAIRSQTEAEHRLCKAVADGNTRLFKKLTMNPKTPELGDVIDYETGAGPGKAVVVGFSSPTVLLVRDEADYADGQSDKGIKVKLDAQ